MRNCPPPLLGVSFGHFDAREGNKYIAMETDEETAFVREVGEAILRCVEELEGGSKKLEEVCEKLDVEVHGAWLRNCKKGKRSGNPTRWWMEECQIAKELYEAHRSRCNLKEYRATTREARNAFFEQKLKVMSAMNRPWEALKWIRPRPPPLYSQIKRPDGTMISTQNELFDVLHGQFNKEDASNTVDWTFINNLPNMPQRPDSAFSTKELWDTLSGTNNSSAPGTDHITWRHIKLALITPGSDIALTQIYNAIYNMGIWPKSFKETVSVVIPKPKKDDYLVPKAYRLIALLKTMGKLFTKMIAKRLQYDGIAHGLFHKGQFGRIQKHSTTDVGIVLMDMISEARDRGLFTTVLAVDIAQFFLSIQHKVMVKLLIKQGFSDKTANLIGSFFEDRKTTYRWGQQESKEYLADLGTPQGDCLLPVLSALYISLLLNTYLLWDLKQDTNCLFFVDDRTLCVSTPTMTCNVSILKRSIELLANYFLKIGIRIEPTKTELMHFTAFDLTKGPHTFKHKCQPDLFFDVAGVTHHVQPKGVWRYLGFFFDSFLKFHHHVHYYTNKAFSTIRACSMLGNSQRGLSPRNRTLAYKAVTLPVLTYGLALWYAEDGRGVKKHLMTMRRVHNFALHWITGAFRERDSKRST